ncbi:MAG: hypothetical protein Q9174_002315 [Haloplaca sp. 1 TL-2023]
MASLASTIVPVHSDASTFTSVTTSPLEPQDCLDPSMELKIPLSESDTPTILALDTANDARAEGVPGPEQTAPKGHGTNHEDSGPLNDILPNAVQELHSENPDSIEENLPLPGPTIQDPRRDNREVDKYQHHISLAALRDAIQLEHYHSNHAASLHREMQGLTLAIGLNGRLIPSLAIARGIMADVYQENDSVSFARLYQASEHISEICNIHYQGALPAAVVPQSLGEDSPAPASWFERLPQEYQSCLLVLITRLRMDKDFLASRLSAMSFTEFTAFFSRSHVSSKSQSIFHVPFQRKHDQPDSSGPRNSPVVNNLRGLHSGNPFFAMFNGIFSASCNAGTLEYRLKTDLWSTACAKVIAEGKPGSDEFVTTVLDAFSETAVWRLKPELERYVAEVLQKGAFLLDQVPKESTKFKEPLETRNAKAAVATSNFFDKALKDLLWILLDSSGSEMLPEGLLEFVHRTLRDIPNPDMRKRARNFIASKWYLASFVCQALTYPEKYGMMTEHHINSIARSNMLREIANRLQKQVFDVIFSWKSMGPVLDPEMHTMVKQLLERFDAADAAPAHSPESHAPEPVPEKGSLMLSAADVAGLLRSLYPSLVVSSSANPSTAGSSTLISDSLLSTKGSKSVEPSLSGTSITSTNGFHSRGLPADKILNSLDKEPTRDTLSWRNRSTGTATDFDHDLARLYGTLDDLLRLSPAPLPSALRTDWSFFETDERGQVSGAGIENKASSPASPDATERRSQDDASQSNNEDLAVAVMRVLCQDASPFSRLPNSALASADPKHCNRVELDRLITAAIDNASSSCRYQDLHYWWQVKNLFHEHENGIDDLLSATYDRCQRNIKADQDRSSVITNELYQMSLLRTSQMDKLVYEARQRKALRIKMWYASDVRHSSTFEDARHVTQALRAMANTSRSKPMSGVAHWAKNRLRTVTGQDRSMSQTLDALTEPNEYSGTSKLNDEQVERTTGWLTRNSIENFCRGEERIHRFCFEIRKCMNKFTGPTLLESPVLWSSRLFEQEKKAFERKPHDGQEHSLYSRTGISLGSSNPYTSASFPSTSHEPRPDLSSPYSRPRHAVEVAGHSPHLLPKGSDLFPKEPTRSLPHRTWQAPTAPLDMPWLATSNDYQPVPEPPVSHQDGRKDDFLTDLKRGFCSLIVSDLGYPLWHSGSETDAWLARNSSDESIRPVQHEIDSTGTGPHFSTKKAQESPNTTGSHGELTTLLMAATMVHQHLDSRWQTNSLTTTEIVTDSSTAKSEQTHGRPFPYRETYNRVLTRFSLSQDAHTKLAMLQELEHLVSQSITESMVGLRSSRSQSQFDHATSLRRSISRNVPVARTKATSFEEVIANCTERRAGTLRFAKPPRASLVMDESESFGTDEIVDKLLSIFRDPDLRPKTLFRDLQYIAALVPAEVLDQTAQGKAFWDVGLAALAHKQEVCDAMIARATDITGYHISASAASSKPPSDVATTSLAHTSLGDAAQLWIVAAKEGSATAARELGLLYLTHPDLLPRTVLQPFAKPKEVFRTVGSGKEGSSTFEEARLDPVTFAVVFHWMEVAANGGDRDARDFLRGNGEWGVGR